MNSFISYVKVHNMTFRTKKIANGKSSYK